MAIQDQNRSRKTYSFFRAMPVPLPTCTGDDLLYYQTVAQLNAAESKTLENGKLAYVATIRDYFTFEKSVNSGSVDLIQDVAGGGGSGGVWHRMNLGGSYWKNQLIWFIDSTNGHDENIGSNDMPIKTIDEFVRRLGQQKIRNDYNITIKNSNQDIENSYGLDIEFDGGTITFTGTPSFSSLGTITTLSGAINYTSSTAPKISILGGGSYNNDLLYVNSNVIGWALSGTTSDIYTTSFSIGSIGQTLYKATIPTINTPGIVVRGFGDIIFDKIKLGLSGTSQIVICGDQFAEITLLNSSLQSNDIIIANGTLRLDKSRISNGGSGGVLINNAQVYGTGSGFSPYSYSISTNVSIINNSHIELGSSIFTNNRISISDSRIICSVNGASGTILNASSLTTKSNSMVDVRNLISTNSLSIPVIVGGQNCTIFYDTIQIPKAEPIAINNGTSLNLLWSSLPWQDMLRQTSVVSGSLTNNWIL